MKSCSMCNHCRHWGPCLCHPGLEKENQLPPGSPIIGFCSECCAILGVGAAEREQRPGLDRDSYGVFVRFNIASICALTLEHKIGWAGMTGLAECWWG